MQAHLNILRFLKTMERWHRLPSGAVHLVALENFLKEVQCGSA